MPSSRKEVVELIRNWAIAVVTILAFLFTLGSSAKSEVEAKAKSYTDGKVETINAKLDSIEDKVDDTNVKLIELEKNSNRLLEVIIRCQNERD